jgi:hypothetical protein
MVKKKSKIKSECCHAEIRYSDIAPDFIEDNPATMRIGTCYCICSKCNQPCNIYVPIRKTWAINPKTKVKGDEHGKFNNKLTKKEIENYRKNEDF